MNRRNILVAALLIAVVLAPIVYFWLFYPCSCCARSVEGSIQFVPGESSRTSVMIRYEITNPPEVENLSHIHLELLLGNYQVVLERRGSSWFGILENSTYVATFNDTNADGLCDLGDIFAVSAHGPREFQSGDELVLSIEGYHGWRSTAFYFP